MGKFLDALKNLGNKLNGTTPSSTTTVAVINEIAEDYVAPQAALTFDTVPTTNSTNPVTSGGIKTYVDGLMSGALKRAIVETLPTEDIDPNTIYMVLDAEASQQGNVYNEYLYINNAWELIGTTATSGGLLSEIKDSNGNARFVEGNGTAEEIEGMTVTYNKFSLSGTHLMLVFAGTFERNVAAYTKVVSFSLPEWILNKIYPIYNTNVEISQFNFYNANGNATNVTVRLQKETNALNFTLASNVDTSSGNLIFRIQFDLLIDTD